MAGVIEIRGLGIRHCDYIGEAVVGLIADLAIGMDRGGSHAWARQKDLLLGLSIGDADKAGAKC